MLSDWLDAICYNPLQRICCAGSGKTHTVVGNPEISAEQGLLARSVKYLDQGIKEMNDGSQFQVGIKKHLPLKL